MNETSPRARTSLLPHAVVASLDQLALDLRTVVADFRGLRRAPFSARSAGARHRLAIESPVASTSTSANAARRLVIREVTRETRDAVSLRLEDPTGAPITFIPGQFLTLLVNIGGATFRRAYSISSALHDTHAAPSVTITVKRITEGRVSKHLNDHANVGDSIEVLGPSGSFTVDAATVDDVPRHLVLIAGGSGITPMMSIVRSVLARLTKTRVSLIYGNRGIDDVIFRDAIAELSRLFSDRFQVVHALSNVPADRAMFACIEGVLDDATCERAVGMLTTAIDHPSTPTSFYLCGPPPMMLAARQVLSRRGVASNAIFEERFTLQRAHATETEGAAQSLRIRHKNGVAMLSTRPGQTLLEAGLEAGVTMPFSCTLGGCGACKVRLISGDVEMDEPTCLTKQERDGGFILACCSRPTTATVVALPEAAT